MIRHVAHRCLRGSSPAPLRSVDRFAAQAGLDERDTALARRLVGTEIRRRGTLRAVVAAFAHQRPKADLATFLRLGAAQLMFLDRVPDHAAISETVRATTDTLGLAKGRIVNGILRELQRSLHSGQSGDPTRDVVGRDLRFDFPVFRDPAEHPHLWAEDALSVPAALHKRWSARHGRDVADELARLALDEPPLSLRAVGGRPRDELQRALQALDVPTTPGHHPAVLLAPPDLAPTVLRSELFASGALTVQGEHALRAAELVGDVSEKSVLDVCSAPGGKTAVLRERGARSLVAVDHATPRLARVRDGFQRLRLDPPALAVMDGATSFAGGARFDAVLVDAPCSNTGVLAQRPNARWRYGPQSQASLVEIQRALLAGAARVVATAGALVHSTCSLEPEENEQIVRAFLDDHPGWTLEEEARSLPRSLDDGGPADGGYAARIRAPSN
ncbi:MAG: transcription antitermination factor NusB [Planctomycetota bacterium]